VAMLEDLYPMRGPHSSFECTRLARLYLAACARKHWEYLPWPCRRLVEWAEECADDPRRVTGPAADLAELLPGRDGMADDWADLTAAVRLHAGGTPTPARRPFRNPDHWQQVARTISFIYYRTMPPFQLIAAGNHNADYVRDLFAPVKRRIPRGSAWRTTQAIGLAETMYKSGRLDRMPILADAMEEAGCADADVLRHCRDDTARHVRGCWVVDLVLGKA
jgi:hypothetical protein